MNACVAEVCPDAAEEDEDGFGDGEEEKESPECSPSARCRTVRAASHQSVHGVGDQPQRMPIADVDSIIEVALTFPDQKLLRHGFSHFEGSTHVTERDVRRKPRVCSPNSCFLSCFLSARVCALTVGQRHPLAWCEQADSTSGCWRSAAKARALI
jgi:hypothetical protein